MEMNEHQLTVLDEQGNEILCNILFTFESERTHKNVVIFYPVEQEDSEDGSIELSAAFYVEGKDGQGDLEPIEADEDWEEVEDAISQFEEEMEHHCGCGCHEHEECECGCGCGEDCECGCHEGKECTCGDDCQCGPECSCHHKE